MNRSLTIRLTVFFLIVALVTASLVFIFVRSTRVSQFQSFIVEQETALLEETIRTYYDQTGTLEGFDTYVRSMIPPNAPASPPDAPPGRPLGRPMGVVDAHGVVLIPLKEYEHGETVPASVLERGIPVKVNNAPIAYIFPDPGPPFPLRGEEQAYLERTNHALLLATVGAVLVALLLGVLFARTLTHPIRDLTNATYALRRGSLGEQVPVRSQDELGLLAATFNQMSIELERAVQARRQMTADIAHDLRTPLQVISGYIDSMMEGDLEPTHERLAIVYTEIEHLQHLVADLRTLSRADAGDLPLNLQPLAAHDLLTRVATVYENQIAQQNLTLSVLVPPDLPLLMVDEERMMQILGNLVSNAQRHTPEGGHIRITAQQAANSVQIAVQDTGEGIATEDLPYLFDRFYRVDRARQDEDGASGLGLAIARALVEAHGGTITATSPGTNQGATFTIALPLHTMTKGKEKEPLTSTRPARGSTR